ncbi:hypothetical protein NLI96_g5136 [Meripilus lineatus]|uniref:RWD domain-containing protein n=1 Tax=Meripilus lineatus TaxID=2056292 RepID=A0AAD5V5N4_9APHY|nr:hypothetical protein NLI96_g5136 [Physisporinus lineatus]
MTLTPPEDGMRPDLNEFIAELSVDPEREPIASELGVLQSIYGDEAIRLWPTSGTNAPSIRYDVALSLSAPFEDVSFSVLVSLPSSYPSTSPPQLQLLSRYIGAFGVDSTLFGAILRTYISSEGIEYINDSVCVFDGLEWAKERCAEWYGEKKSEKAAGELIREDEKGGIDGDVEEDKSKHQIAELETSLSISDDVSKLPQGLEIFEAEPITDRKSSFVGRACRISDPSQVPVILAHLSSDRRISRAAHPIINAWRCQVGNVLHQGKYPRLFFEVKINSSVDNDDDGENAAGGRLAHLLQILEVNNVLVIVSRYWGGIPLGPDRFKHINQAARNALDLGGFLEVPEGNSSGKRHTGRKKR